MVNNIYIIIILALVINHAAADNYCEPYNCYELLGVSIDDDEHTIKKAFREMAKKYHPDKNRHQDTTQLFQKINKAYQTLTNEKSRFKYNLHLQNPGQSDYYHQYRYYSNKYIQNPQIHPALVISAVLLLVSLLQYVMRNQMYQRAIIQITDSQDFKSKVNAKAGKNKHLKDQIRQQMINDIEIEGGYSKPTYKDILAYKTLILPYTLCLSLYSLGRWILKYYIKKEEYTAQDREYLTIKALDITSSQWQRVASSQKDELLLKKLWIKQNLKMHREEMREKWLQQLRIQKPRHYQMVMKQLKKNA